MDSSHASTVLDMLSKCAYLHSGIKKIESLRRDFMDARNSTGKLMEVMHSEVFIRTLGPWFTGNVKLIHNTLVFPGAILWGRLFSLCVRLATVKRRNTDGTVIPFDTASMSYERLSDDALYFAALAMDMCNDLWCIQAEVFHFTRGVEAFYRGVITECDESSANTVYFIADVCQLRQGIVSVSDETSKSTFDDHVRHFVYTAMSMHLEVGGPPRINKLVSIESREVLGSYAFVHLLQLKTSSEDRASRKRKMRPSAALSRNRETEEDHEKRVEATKARAPAVKRMTTPHVVALMSTDEFGTSITKHDVFRESASSGSVYDRYTVEQSRLRARLDILAESVDQVTPLLHGVTIHHTQQTANHLNALKTELENYRSGVGYLQAYSKSARNLLGLEGGNNASLGLRGSKNKTVPVYINPSNDLGRFPTETKLFKTSKLSDAEKQQNATYGGMERVFREVRRMTTLMYLLWDQASGENMKVAKQRLPKNQSFLSLLNSGRENNAFAFNTEYDESSDPNLDAIDPFTLESIYDLCVSIDTTAGVTGFKDNKDIKDYKVKHTVFRVPRLWTTGMEDSQDTGRIIAQYSYGSYYEVGARVGGVYVFRNNTLLDDVELLRWNLLYDERQPPEQVPQNVVEMKNFLISKGKEVVAAEKLSAENMQKSETLSRLSKWWDELGGDQYYIGLQKAVDGELEAKAVETYNLRAAYEQLILESPNHFDVRDNKFIDPMLGVYNDVTSFRIKRREDILKKKQQQLTEVDKKWFLRAFGVTPAAYFERHILCGQVAQRVLVPKKMPVVEKSMGLYGTMFVNERMTMEFGEENDQSDTDSVLNVVGKSTGDTAQTDLLQEASRQFAATQQAMDTLWSLLARMSAVGILNTDAHLGNYMVTKYKQERTTVQVCKAIDFDPSFTTVFTSDDLGDNTEGWKPIYVLNVLMVLYTLSQDSGRSKLYELFKNTTRVQESSSKYKGKFASTLDTSRISQFGDIVAETMRAIKTTPTDKMSTPQRLLAAEWLGGFKGNGRQDDLTMHLSVFQDWNIMQNMFTVANRMNLIDDAWKDDPTNTWRQSYLAYFRKWPDPEEGARKDVSILMNSVKATVAENALLLNFEDSDKEIDRTITKMRSIDLDPVLTTRKPVKISTQTGDELKRVHLIQTEWTLRQNIFWRSFIEPAKIISTQWAKRQANINMIVKSTDDETLKRFDGSSLSSSDEAKLLGAMGPITRNEYYGHKNALGSFFRRTLAPMMYHATRARPPGYTILEFLYDYVYNESVRDIGPGKGIRDLMPHFPLVQTETEQEDDWWKWKISMTDANRPLLSLPGYGNAVPTGSDTDVVNEMEP